MPVLYDETQERFGYSVDEAQDKQNILIECDACGRVATRSKKHLHENGQNFCKTCIMKQYGRKGHTDIIRTPDDKKPVFKCKLCGVQLSFSHPYCDACGKKVVRLRTSLGYKYPGFSHAPGAAA